MSSDESSAETATEDEPKDTEKGKAGPKSEDSTSAAASLDEEKINAPSRRDLVMLGVICVSTLILWAAGRAACNYQVPGESLTPRKVSLEERTRTPKHVGIEFAQAIGGGDFDTAGELARGEALAFVKKDRESCGACDSRKQAAEKLLSVGTVLKSNSLDSVVSVKTIGGDSETVRVLGIEREGRKWYVTRIYESAADAELKDDPSAHRAPVGLRRPEGEPPAEDESSQEGGGAEKSELEGATAATPKAPAPQPKAPAPQQKAPTAPETGTPRTSGEPKDTASSP